jgi:hypothetical protein
VSTSHQPPSDVPTDGARRPAPLTVAATLAALEGLALVAYGVAELAHLSTTRLEMGLTTSFFFFLYGAALIACAVVVSRRGSWARSPLVLAQLIQCGIAVSFWGGSTTGVAVALIVVAVVALAGLLHPASIDYLARED